MGTIKIYQLIKQYDLVVVVKNWFPRSSRGMTPSLHNPRQLTQGSTLFGHHFCKKWDFQRRSEKCRLENQC